MRHASCKSFVKKTMSISQGHIIKNNVINIYISRNLHDNEKFKLKKHRNAVSDMDIKILLRREKMFFVPKQHFCFLFFGGFNGIDTSENKMGKRKFEY